MMKVLDYLYIGFYRLLLKTNQKDIAEFLALIFLTVSLIIYLSILLAILMPDVKSHMSVKLFGFIVYALIGVVNYFIFIMNDRYKTIYERHLSLTFGNQQLCSIVSLTFTIGGMVGL